MEGSVTASRGTCHCVSLLVCSLEPFWRLELAEDDVYRGCDGAGWLEAIGGYYIEGGLGQCGYNKSGKPALKDANSVKQAESVEPIGGGCIVPWKVHLQHTLVSRP